MSAGIRILILLAALALLKGALDINSAIEAGYAPLGVLVASGPLMLLGLVGIMLMTSILGDVRKSDAASRRASERA
jgi:hypothetical protein